MCIDLAPKRRQTEDPSPPRPRLAMWKLAAGSFGGRFWVVFASVDVLVAQLKSTCPEKFYTFVLTPDSSPANRKNTVQLILLVLKTSKTRATTKPYNA